MPRRAFCCADVSRGCAETSEVSRVKKRPTCGCRKRPPARFPCFRPVIYRERRN